MKLFFFTIAVVAVLFAWSHFSKPADPAVVRAKAQMHSNKVLDYWIEAARDDRVEDMRLVSKDRGVGHAANILEQIHEAEAFAKAEFDDYATFGMGGGGAVKALLSAPDVGVLMPITIRVAESDGKWWIVGATAE